MRQTDCEVPGLELCVCNMVAAGTSNVASPAGNMLSVYTCHELDMGLIHATKGGKLAPVFTLHLGILFSGHWAEVCY